MSLLENYRTPRLADPVFGPMTFAPEGEIWEGQVSFPPTGLVVRVSARAGREGPSEGQHGAYERLCERYGELEPSLAAQVFQVFGAWTERAGLPSPADASELWALIRLDRLQVGAEGRLELTYVFRDRALKAAFFVVFVRGGVVSGRR